ncbi:FtsX-like permease family protein [Streptomyces sp. NPDC051940]|uniref:FtsX-like permease family protein n=1 Tax=Streptomyces sp. NPDC051940 TaxID=3155675 RepID=UPI0034423483
MRWARELGLGVRLAAGGGRQGWTRTLLSALGIGLGVATLLIAASIPAIVDRHADRVSAREVARTAAPGPDTTAVVPADRTYLGREVRGRLLHPDGPEAPLPPGLTAVPGPGEVVASPALERLLDSSGGSLLRLRFTGRTVVGTIGDEGLGGPQELAFYEGVSDVGRYGERVRHVSGFGVPRASSFAETEPLLLLLVLVAVIVLLLPVAVFVATAVRFGGDQRDRRLAALRLSGADAAATRRIAAGESLLGAVGGLVAGLGIFLLLRRWAGLVVVQGQSVFPADVAPHPVFAVFVGVAVPVAAVAVTVFALRGVLVEPLGVVREGGVPARRLWPRLVLPAAGLVALAPAGPMGNARVGAGVALLPVGAVLLLPWLVERTVRGLHRGPLSWQLAARRLQAGSGAAARTVSGVAVAVAGAIALQMLLASVQAEYTQDRSGEARLPDLGVAARAADHPRSAALIEALRGTRGVREADGATKATVTGVEPLGGDVEAVVADCPTLRRHTGHRGPCEDGDAFLAPVYQDLLKPGLPIRLVGTDGPVRVRIPDDVRLLDTPGTIPDGDSPNWREVLYFTPSAVDLRGTALRTTVALRFDPADPGAAERAATVALRYDPQAELRSERLPEFRKDFADIRTAVLLGAVGLLLVIGGGVLVTVCDQLRQAGPPLAVLAAFGARRRTLALSVLWQTAYPLAVGLAVATVTGVGLGSLLLVVGEQPVRLHVADLLALAGAGAAVTLLVAVLALPALGRLMRPEGLRAE